MVGTYLIKSQREHLVSCVSYRDEIRHDTISWRLVAAILEYNRPVSLPSFWLFLPSSPPAEQRPALRAADSGSPRPPAQCR